MPALINTAIPKQNFELIGDKIGAILTLELNNQKILDDTLPAVKIFRERWTAFDKTELPAINIMLVKGTYDRKTRRLVHGDYSYFIEVYANSPATADNKGDELSAQTMLRITGLIRAILENPAYEILGYERNEGIETTGVQSINILEKDNTKDALSTTQCRIVFNVKVPEGTPLSTGVLCTASGATVTLSESANGYQYEFTQSV